MSLTPPKPCPEAVASAEKHYNAVLDCFPNAVQNFERKYQAWHAACLAHSDAGATLEACTATMEFESVSRLGPKIVTFVVHKLAKDEDGQSFNDVFLYKALENDPEYLPKLSDDQPSTSEESLRHLAVQIVELNYKRNQDFEQRVQAWSQHHREHWLQAGSRSFTMTEEYFDLVEMGTSIIAPVMVSYFHLHWGYWWQLLHELIHGRQMGAYSYQPGAIYDACVEWFNEGDHEDAPLYIQTDDDRRFAGEPWSTLKEWFGR